MIYTYNSLDTHIEDDSSQLLDRIKRDKKEIISKDKIKNILSKYFGYKDFDHLKKTYKNKENKEILYLTKKELCTLKSNYNKHIEKHIHDGKFKFGYSCHFTFLDQVIPHCKRTYNSNLENKLKIDLTKYDCLINLDEEQFEEYCLLFCDIENKHDEDKIFYLTKQRFKLIFSYLKLLKKPISKKSIYENIKIELIEKNLNNTDKNISLISKEIFNHFNLHENNAENFHYSFMTINYILRHPYFFKKEHSDIKLKTIEFSELKKRNLEILFHDYHINSELLEKLVKSI